MVKEGSGKRKVFIVLNGKKSGDSDLRTAVKHLRKEGHDVEVRVTYEAGDSDRFAKEALNLKDVDVIVAAGGDGSVNELAAALLKADAPKETAIAVIPMGTANDFATAANIPQDPWEALQLAVQDTASPIDIGLVNDQVFMNVATGGTGAEITVQTDEGLKDRLGGAAYLLTGLTKPGSLKARQARGRAPLNALTKRDGRYQPIEVGEGKMAEITMHRPRRNGSKAEAEKAAEFEGNLLVLAVGNSRQAGGGVQLCPDALLDDGLLDVSYVLNVPVDKVGDLVSGLLDGSKKVSDMPEVFGTLRCNWLYVDCPDGLQINRDGEPMRDTSFHFEVLPKRFRLHMPRTDLLITGAARGERAESGQGSGQRNLSRASPQSKFEQKIQHPRRPRFEDKNVAKIKGIVGHAVKTGIIFAAGGATGVFLHRRGWFRGGLGR